MAPLTRASHNQGAPSTVGRGKTVMARGEPSSPVFELEGVTLCYGDSLRYYTTWSPPNVIVSDGGYGLLGFEGDTSDHLRLPEWYETHVEAWSRAVQTTAVLWFWNSEIGWAAVHPVLERHRWRYVNCNIWIRTHDLSELVRCDVPGLEEIRPCRRSDWWDSRGWSRDHRRDWGLFVVLGALRRHDCGRLTHGTAAVERQWQVGLQGLERSSAACLP